MRFSPRDGCEERSFEPSPTLGRLLPVQAEVYRAPLTPEQNLMLAVLEDVVGEFQRYATAWDRGGRRLFADAEGWLASNDVEWPFAFLNVCEALDLDAHDVRAALWRWRDRARAQAPRDKVRVAILPAPLFTEDDAETPWRAGIGRA
jgi:hypothetical protein